MKKYLLFIISMLCVSIGAWADSGSFGTNSSWETSGTTLTLNINTTSDITSYWEAVTSLTSIEKVVVTTGPGVTLTCGAWDAPLTFINRYYYTVPLLDLSNANISTVTSGTQQLLKMEDNNNAFKHILLPSTYESSLSSMLVTDAYYDSETYNTNLYTVSGTVVTALFKNTSEHLALSAINSEARTLKLAGDVSGSITLTTEITAAMAGADTYTVDLSNVTTGGDTSTNPITVSAGTKVNCLSEGVKDRVTGTDSGNINFVNPNITCNASELNSAITALGGVAPTSVTLTSGTLTSEVMTTLNGLTSLKRINLQDVTIEAALNTIELPSTLKALVLPAAATMDETLKTKVTNSNLDYVYIPTNQTQDEEHQTTADYIWVNKPGGLSNALDNEAKLRSSWYMVVESDVALDNNDVNFWGPGETAREMQYRYLDFSGANVTPAVLYNYRVTDQLPYRIILPDDWTGDDMAVFAANPNCGNIAAVYSYTGTDHKRLDILELHDKAYMPTALNNPRIVRSGTTSIRVVSGHYGSNPVYGKLGKNLLAAINDAANSITSVTIAVGSGIYTLQNEGQENVEDVLVSTSTTFAFANTHLTNLTMNYVNNSYLTVDVSGCSALTSLYLNETTLAGVNAANVSTLTTASLGHAIVGGDVNLSGTALTSLLEVDLAQITGTLDVSNSTATSFDFTQLTAMSVNASNTNLLRSMDLNGITLNGMPDDITSENIASRIGTVEVTRDSRNYSNLDIAIAESGFDNNRIVPNSSNSSAAYDECVSTYETNLATWEAAFSTWLYDNKATYLSDEKETELRTTYSEFDDDIKAEYNNSADDYVKYRMLQGDIDLKDLDTAKTDYATTSGGSSEPENNCESTGYVLSTIEEAHVELTVAGSSLSENINNIWLDTDGNNTADAHPTQTEIEILHVTGTVTTDDLNYIAGMTGLKTLDLSEATGVTYSDITNAGLSTKTAIILPGTTNTEADMVTAMNAFQTAGYECVGYYTAKSETSKKLNVYGYNGTVANLKTGNITSQINATAEGETGQMVEQPKLIGTNTDLTFLPVYGNTTASVPYLSTDNISYPQATPSLLTAFRENFNGTDDYPYSVDMSWLDISNLGVDFSGVKCRHLVIPQNTMVNTTTRYNVVYHNDFTDETADAVVDGTQHRYYKYNEMVYAVSTYKSNSSPYGLQAYYDGKGILFTNGYGGLDETATLTYLRSAGQEHLNDVVSHMSPLLQEADVIMLKGTLTEDIDGLNALTNDRIDLTRATMTSMSGFDNDNVKYLALPDGMNDAIAATSADDFAFSGCEALKAVGAYDPDNTKYTVHSTANTVTFTDETKTACLSQEESVFEITKMCAPNASRQAGSALGTTNIVMSGYLTLSDIQMDGADAKAGLNTNSAGSVVTADFSNAVFMNNNDMCFTAATWNGKALTSILLPTDERQNTIPARSLYNYSALTEICIPYNYEYIGNAAFYLANLGHITTTDANGALVDNGEHTFTFSKNLKEIGEAPSPLTTGEGNAAYPTPLAEPVFFSYGYHDLTDIYVLRTGYEDGDTFNPTKCYRNAFGAGPTYGWGGFDGGNVYCREKYLNGSQLYTVLHFPDLASVSNDETKYNNVKEAYTDPTRVYTKKDQTGAVDANGNTPEWPTFSELGRAYNEATRGLIWNDWTYTEANQKAGNIEGGTITTPPGNPADVSLVASPTKFDMNYTGWHEFVLALATYVAPDEKVDENNKIYRQYVKDNDWYTFCIPFDMTQEEVTLLLGVPVATDQIVTTTDELSFDGDGKVSNGENITPNTTALLPEIRTIKSVTRNASTTTVAIYTSFDLAEGEKANTYYNPSTTEYDANGDNAASQPITIRAGYPYLIKPYKIKGTTISNLGKQVMTRYEFAMAASGINREGCWDAFGNSSKFARPYEGHKVRATEDSEAATALSHTDTAHSGQDYNYTFVGQFWQQDMPLHCFYQNSKHVWRHYMTYNAAYQWYPYICIIMVTDESKSEEAKGGKFRDEENCKYPNLQGTDAKGHDVFDKNLQLTYKNGLDDNFGASARNYQFFFDEDIIDMGDGSETTAIDRLDGVDIIPANGKVYNMNGQLVGKSLDGLSKGMYIVNGKKYVIK